MKGDLFGAMLLILCVFWRDCDVFHKVWRLYITRGFVGARLCAWMWQKGVNLILDSLGINFGRVENMERKGGKGGTETQRKCGGWEGRGKVFRVVCEISGWV